MKKIFWNFIAFLAIILGSILLESCDSVVVVASPPPGQGDGPSYFSPQEGDMIMGDLVTFDGGRFGHSLDHDYDGYGDGSANVMDNNVRYDLQWYKAEYGMPIPVYATVRSSDNYDTQYYFHVDGLAWQGKRPGDGEDVPIDPLKFNVGDVVELPQGKFKVMRKTYIAGGDKESRDIIFLRPFKKWQPQKKAGLVK